MRETDDDLVELQRLLDQSIARSGEHLRSIITPGKRTLTAHQLATVMGARDRLPSDPAALDGRLRVPARDHRPGRGHR